MVYICLYNFLSVFLFTTLHVIKMATFLFNIYYKKTTSGLTEENICIEQM